MTLFSRDFAKTISNAVQKFDEFLHKAVPAVSRKQMVPRWRNLGRQIIPYHFLKPVPVQVVAERRKA